MRRHLRQISKQTGSEQLRSGLLTYKSTPSIALIEVCKGRQHRRRSYEFSKGYLIDLTGKPVALVFDTVAVNGVSYHFEGEYQAMEKNSDALIHLQGSMRKLVGNNQSADVELRFRRFDIIM